MRDEDFSDFDDEIPPDSLDEPEICAACNGSGEGMYEGTNCAECRGHGER